MALQVIDALGRDLRPVLNSRERALGAACVKSARLAGLHLTHGA